MKSIHKASWVEDKQTYNKTYKNEEGKRQKVLEAVYHSSMITRATSEFYKVKYPTYLDVTVTENMADYNSFVGWCNRQIGFGKEGWVLDKDILDPSNKTYHEDYCVFVPSIVNAFFTFVKTGRKNGLPVGVSWCESEQNYHSYCAQLNGKNKTLGRFQDPNKAGKAYEVFKKSLATKLADTYKDELDSRVTKALYDFEVKNYSEVLNADHPSTRSDWKEMEERTISGESYNSRNTSGKVGVRWRAERNNWEASISVDYKHIQLYYGPSYEDAVKAREVAEIKYEKVNKENN